MMKLIDLNDLKNFKDNSVITIGFFDGLHKGHQVILSTLSSYSKKNNYKSVIISFDESVLDLFKMSKNICSVSQKLDSFKAFDIDYVLLLKVSDNFMGLSAKEFVDNYLEKLNTKIVVCGSDFSFAKNKEGNIDYVRKYTNYVIVSVDDEYVNDIKISSTYIRNLLSNGKVDLANSLLYEDFNIVSKVIQGKKIGRTIGFKTANVKVNNQVSLLKKGVYFGKAIIDNKAYKAMINVGINPTIKDSLENIKVEAHILGIDLDLYDLEIKVIFNKFHREEIKFDSLENLKQQLSNDAIELEKQIKL